MGCAQAPEGSIVSVDSYSLAAASGCEAIEVVGVDTCNRLQQVVGEERAAAVLAGGV